MSVEIDFNKWKTHSMYDDNGTYYTQKYSISFGKLVDDVKALPPAGGLTPGGGTTGSGSGSSSNSETYTNTKFSTVANTWTTWHLIPSSRPSVAHPSIVTKYVEIPGTDSSLDLTNYLTGRQMYGQRQGSWSFNVANGYNWETIRSSMVKTLHGKKLKMILQDDPDYYYEGRFTVGQWETGANFSKISISYQLEPYKLNCALNVISVPINTGEKINFAADDYPYHLYATLRFGEGGYLKFGSHSKVLVNSTTTQVDLGTALPNATNKLDNSPGTSPTGSGEAILTWRRGGL